MKKEASRPLGRPISMRGSIRTAKHSFSVRFRLPPENHRGFPSWLVGSPVESRLVAWSSACSGTGDATVYSPSIVAGPPWRLEAANDLQTTTGRSARIAAATTASARINPSQSRTTPAANAVTVNPMRHHVEGRLPLDVRKTNFGPFTIYECTVLVSINIAAGVPRLPVYSAARPLCETGRGRATGRAACPVPSG
jgi:hypothetical protein